MLTNELLYTILWYGKKVLKQLVVKGFSIREIAKKVNLGYSTVRYYLKKYSLKTKKIKNSDNYCKIHGTNTTFYISKNGRTRCRRCNVELVQKRRNDLKKRA